MRTRAISAMLALGALATTTPATFAAPTTPAVTALHASGMAVATHRKTGKATFIASGDGSPRTPQSIAPGAAARANGPDDFVDLLGPSFGLARGRQDTKLARDRTDQHGLRSSRYTQLHRGLPVVAGELIVNTDASGRMLAMAGRAAPDLAVATTPGIDATSAAAIATELIAKHNEVPASALAASAPELAVYDPRLVDGGDGLPAGLVWRLEVRALSLAPIREYVLVDATSGVVRLHFNQVHTALSRKTYDTMNVRSAPMPGTFLCDESSDECTGNVVDAVNAHRYARDTYDYYLTRHGRDSIDGLGMEIISTVRFCQNDLTTTCPYQNAFWNGTQMVYGAGFASADDVVAHEITHGITHYEAGLFYYYQSGAINESMSDVFGEIVDLSNGHGNDAAGVRWLIGEDLPVGAIRSMANPTAYGDPDRMRSANYYVGPNDSGGVHTNSAVNNKAAALMVDGGVFNGQTVNALGLVKVGRIYYRTLTAYLVSGSDYPDLYNALYQSCIDLLGVDGITGEDCKSVRAATDAVEMNLEPVAGFSPEATMCPAGQGIGAVLFADDMEGLLTRWQMTSTRVGTNLGWGTFNSFATSGTVALRGPDPGVATDLNVAMGIDVAVAPGSHLFFRHFYNFERSPTTFFDGGVVEYSTDGGANWSDAGPLRVEGAAYGGTLSTTTGNPIGGRRAFVGLSHGFVSTRYNLAAIAGQLARFRWRIGTDAVGAGSGWLVDDVSVHACVNSPAITFTTPTTASLPVNTFGTYAVNASGTPGPTYSAFGALPPGVSFSGASFVGTPALGTVGAWPVTILARNGVMPDALQTFTLTIVRAQQAVAFPAMASDRSFEAGAFDVAPIPGASGMPVTLASVTPSVCTVAGIRVQVKTIGSCTLVASQPGNADYEDAPAAMRTFAIKFTVPKKKRVDFNKDGRADMLWQSATGRTAEWLMNGATQVGGRELFGAGTGWTPKLVADFNGDGYADILFEHTDGSSAMWLMNGDTQIGGARLLNAGTGWTAKLAADFNGDGKADIVWEHTDGRVAMWLMNGTSMASGGVILAGGFGWHPKFSADFNNDGKADILWEHNDQSSALWIMDGLTQVGGGRLFGAGTGWTSSAVADLNGDRKDDIVWTHTDGRVAVWLMDGAAQAGGAVILGAATGYALVAARDIDGDGRDDIVWAKADGTTAYWLMNGTSQVGGGGIFPAGAGWKIKRVIDLDGDGRADWIAVHADGSVNAGIYNGSGFTVGSLLPAGTGYVPVVVPE